MESSANSQRPAESIRWIVAAALVTVAWLYREGCLRIGTVQPLCLVLLAIAGYCLGLHWLLRLGVARSARCDGNSIVAGKLSVALADLREVRVGRFWTSMKVAGGKTFLVPSIESLLQKLAASAGPEVLWFQPKPAGPPPVFLLVLLAMGGLLGTHLEFAIRWLPLGTVPLGSQKERLEPALATAPESDEDFPEPGAGCGPLRSIGPVRLRLRPADVAAIELCDDRSGHRVRFADGSRIVLCPAGSPPLRPDASLAELAERLLAGPRHGGVDEEALTRLRALRPSTALTLVSPAAVCQLDRLLEVRQEVLNGLAGHRRFVTPFGSGFWLDLDASSHCRKWHDVIHLRLEESAFVLYCSGRQPSMPFPRSRAEAIVGSCRLAGMLGSDPAGCSSRRGERSRLETRGPAAVTRR